MVARQIESTRSRPLLLDTPDVTQQRSRERNALHQIHPSSWRHTDIATLAPPSASTPAHYPSNFSALAPLDTEVDESEFAFVPWDASRLLQQHLESELAFYNDAGKSQPDRRRYIWLHPISAALFFCFCRFSPRFTSCAPMRAG